MKFLPLLVLGLGSVTAFVTTKPSFVVVQKTKHAMVVENAEVQAQVQDRLRHKSKVCVITGASQGLGQAMAYELAKYGQKIVVNYYPGLDESAQATVDQIKVLGGDGIAIAADCTNPEQIKRMFSQVMDHYGKVDGTFPFLSILHHGYRCRW
jgi:hypothetical protein